MKPEEKVTFRDGKTLRRRELVVEMIQAGFKALARTNHPDVGGSHAAIRLRGFKAASRRTSVAARRAGSGR